MRLPGLDIAAGSIYCIGRNYAEHAKELGNAVPEKPLVFMKPRASLCYDGESIVLPEISQNVHHETEIVVAIGSEAVNVNESAALNFVAGFAVGIDVTARDVQDELKKKGSPWTLAKGLPTFAPVGRFVKAALPLSIELDINGESRQRGSSDQMIFPIPTLISYLSRTFHLFPGDLIFTGTPAGVGPMKRGDRLEARLVGHDILRLNVR